MRGRVDKLKALANFSFLNKIKEISASQKIKVYLVGGAIRDLFLKKDSSRLADFDFAVDRGAVKLGKMLARQIGAVCVILDKKKRTVRLVCTEKGRRYELDFTDLRAATIKEDLKLRDFTINTFCLDLRRISPSGSDVFDYFGAAGDLAKRRIRLTDKKNFEADPLRILRGFAFCAQFGFRFEPKTKMLIKKSLPLLKGVSAERICEELVKIFSSKNSCVYLRQMSEMKITDTLFPEICAMRGLDQGAYHHLDVWEHSLETLAQLEKILKKRQGFLPQKYARELSDYLGREIVCGRPLAWILKFACLFHDIGKPLTKTIDAKGMFHFYSHEKLGAGLVDKIGRRLKFSLKEIALLNSLVRYHLRPGQLVNRVPSKRAKFRFFRDAKENAPALLLLALADRRAMRGEFSKKENFIFLENEIIKMLEDFFKSKEEVEKKEKLLDGHDVMKLLKIPPGPPVGKLLSALEEAQAVKFLKDKGQAERLVLKMYNAKYANRKK